VRAAGKSWNPILLARAGQRGGFVHQTCAAARPNGGEGHGRDFSCLACGGSFAKCFGKYGYRSSGGTWTEGHSSDPAVFPESPNGRFCCAACEAAGNTGGSGNYHRTPALPPGVYHVRFYRLSDGRGWLHDFDRDHLGTPSSEGGQQL